MDYSSDSSDENFNKYEDGNAQLNCKIFRGTYLISTSSIFFKQGPVGIKCKCPGKNIFPFIFYFNIYFIHAFYLYFHFIIFF